MFGIFCAVIQRRRHLLNQYQSVIALFYFYGVRTFVAVIVFLFASCAGDPHSNNPVDSGNGNSLVGSDYSGDYPEDSTGAAHYYDSVVNAGGFAEWTIYDSLPAQNISLWRKYDTGNNATIQLRYPDDGQQKTIVITDSLAGYMHESFEKHMQLVQLNGIGSEELVVFLGGFYSSSGWGEYVSYGQEYDYVYIYNLDDAHLIWYGTTASEAYQYCPAKSDSDCTDFEAGYDYKMHFSPGTFVIDSVHYFGDSKESDLDHSPGRYEWHDGMFVRMSE